MAVSNEKQPQAYIGAHIANKEDPTPLQSKLVGGHIFMGIIKRVNADSAKMDIQLMGDTDVVAPDISIAFPYVGPAGFIGTLPEVGSMVVLARTSYGLVPVSYTIPQREFALSYNMVEDFPSEFSDPLQEPFRVRPSVYRHLRPGDTRISSSQNAELFLNEDVELHDSKGSGLRIRSGDSAIMSTSQQNYMFSMGVWRSAGPIQRNSLSTTLNGVDVPGYVTTGVTHSDGTKAVYIGGGYEYGGTVYNEYRLEVEDSCPIATPVNDINAGVNSVQRSPKVVHVLGNMVGNNTLDSATYGKFLAPKFTTSIIGEGQLAFEALTADGTDQDAIGRRGVAWAYSVPDKSFVGVDKEGVYHAYHGASRAGGVVGLSTEIVARGGKKEEWGSILEGNLSWDLFCKGGIKWVIGKSTESPGKNLIPRSLTARYIGGTYVEHGYTQNLDPKVLLDAGGVDLPYAKKLSYRKVERVFGNAREEITGNSDEFVNGAKTVSIGAQLAVSVSGASSESVIGDKTINTTGSFTVNASNIQLVSQNRKEKFAAGSVEKAILLGNDLTAIAAGNHIVTIATGNQSSTIGAGSITDSVATGSIANVIGAGSFSVAVTTGGISQVTAAGTVTIGGTAISIAAATAFDVVAATVGLGLIPTRSGVITFLSHKDYVTGAPLIPSLTVMAAL